jgi:hypothetical protein
MYIIGEGANEIIMVAITKRLDVLFVCTDYVIHLLWSEYAEGDKLV